jgi:hypothetical protein
MNLKTTPFSEEEKTKTYQISTFNELGLEINMLNEITSNSRKIPSGNNYRFGIIKNGNYYWYFNGNSVANDRSKMRQIYSGLLEVNKKNENITFIFKVKRL